MCQAAMFSVFFQEGHFKVCHEFGSLLRTELLFIVVSFGRGSGVGLRFVDNNDNA